MGICSHSEHGDKPALFISQVLRWGCQGITAEAKMKTQAHSYVMEVQALCSISIYGKYEHFITSNSDKLAALVRNDAACGECKQCAASLTTNPGSPVMTRTSLTGRGGHSRTVTGKSWSACGGGEVKAQPREAKEEYRRKVRSFRAASWRRSEKAWKTSQATRRRAATWKRVMLWKQMRVTCFLTGLTTQPQQQETMDYTLPRRETKMSRLEWPHVRHCGFQHRSTAGERALSRLFHPVDFQYHSVTHKRTGIILWQSAVRGMDRRRSAETWLRTSWGGVCRTTCRWTPPRLGDGGRCGIGPDQQISGAAARTFVSTG